MLKTTDLNYTYEWWIDAKRHKYYDCFKTHCNAIDNIERLRQLLGGNKTLFISVTYPNCNYFLVCPAGWGLESWMQNPRDSPKLSNQDK